MILHLSSPVCFALLFLLRWLFDSPYLIGFSVSFNPVLSLGVRMIWARPKIKAEVNLLVHLDPFFLYTDTPGGLETAVALCFYAALWYIHLFPSVVAFGQRNWRHFGRMSVKKNFFGMVVPVLTNAKETARIGVSAGRNGVGGDDDGPKNKLATPRHASVMMTDRRTFHERGSRDTGVGAFGRIRAAGVQTQLRSCRTHCCLRLELRTDA
jgi:hypothetical protein